MEKTTKQNKERQQRFIKITGVIIVLIIVLFFINQMTGPNSVLEISPVGSSASVFIDRSRTNALNPNSPTTYNLSDSRHQVLVARDGYWPWTDSVTTEAGEVSRVAPFLIAEAGRRVVQVPENIAAALADKQSQPTPSATEPAISPDGNIRVYVDNETNIIAQWTDDASSALEFFNCFEGTCGVSVYNNQPIKDIAFYPGRSDVIFFATDSGVYAIEVDPTENTQNFQPVVENVSNPIFVLGDGSIFVSVNGRVTVSEF